MLGELNGSSPIPIKSIEGVFDDIPVNFFHYRLLFMAGEQYVISLNEFNDLIVGFVFRSRLYGRCYGST